MFKFVNGQEKEHLDSINKVEQLEKKYNIIFPDVLKEYYKKYDGEKIILSTFEKNGYECEVAKIVPIIAEKMDFEKITDNDRIDGFISEDLYPLARDRGGNYYYWSSKNEKVFLILVDDFENPFEVANSVKEFFDLLG